MFVVSTIKEIGCAVVGMFDNLEGSLMYLRL